MPLPAASGQNLVSSHPEKIENGGDNRQADPGKCRRGDFQRIGETQPVDFVDRDLETDRHETGDRTVQNDGKDEASTIGKALERGDKTFQHNITMGATAQNFNESRCFSSRFNNRKGIAHGCWKKRVERSNALMLSKLAPDDATLQGAPCIL